MESQRVGAADQSRWLTEIAKPELPPVIDLVRVLVQNTALVVVGKECVSYTSVAADDRLHIETCSTHRTQMSQNAETRSDDDSSKGITHRDLLHLSLSTSGTRVRRAPGRP